MAEPERLEPMEPPFSLLRRQLPSREAKCGTKMVSIILCASTVGCVTSLCPPQTPNFSLLTSTAIPHNSKCRYGERGAAAAKPKAQIILDAAKVSAASGGCSEPKQGQRSQSAGGLLPPKHDAGTATRHYRAFWQCRCRAAAAGAVLEPQGGNCAVLP